MKRIGTAMAMATNAQAGQSVKNRPMTGNAANHFKIAGNILWIVSMTFER
jgi:hypothetical protein